MELYLNVVTVTVTAELPLYDDAFYNRFVACADAHGMPFRSPRHRVPQTVSHYQESSLNHFCK